MPTVTGERARLPRRGRPAEAGCDGERDGEDDQGERCGELAHRRGSFAWGVGRTGARRRAIGGSPGAAAALSIVLTRGGPARLRGRRSTSRAQWRPSLIAQTISDCPRRASPAANTPVTELAWRAHRCYRAPSSATPSCSTTPRARDAGTPSRAARDRRRSRCSVPASGANGGAASALATCSASTRPSPRDPRRHDREVELAAAGALGLLHRVGEAQLVRPARPRRAVVVAPRRWLRDDLELDDRRASSRIACPTQSAPVSPPPITTTLRPAALIG